MQKTFAPSLGGTLHNALVAAAGDRARIRSALEGERDRGSAWLDSAWLHLRRLLWEGRVGDAEPVGKLIAEVLDATCDHPAGDAGEPAPMTTTRQAGTSLALTTNLAGLVSGISAVLDRQLARGLTELADAGKRTDVHPTLSWCAFMWLSRTHLRMGDLAGALAAAQQAEHAAAELDDHAAGSVEALVGQIQRYDGHLDRALEHLNEAARLLKGTGHARALANAHLLRARVRAEMGEEGAAHVAASVAERADPTWEAPAVFRAYRALIQGQTGDAEREIAPFDTDRGSTASQRSPDIRRVKSLVKLAELGRIESSVMKEYCLLCGRAPSEEGLQQLEKLVDRNPQFHLLRELYAWELTNLGQFAQAEHQFRLLEHEKLDEELASSVLLGLSCLAGQVPEEEPGRTQAPVTPLDIEDLVLLAEPQAKPGNGTSEHLSAAPPPLPAPTTEVPSIGDLLPGKTGLTGDLAAFPLPDLVDFLRGSRRSGTLMITTDGRIGTLVLCAGQLIDASAPEAPTLTQILTETQQVEPTVLTETARKNQDADDCSLLSMLVDGGIIDSETAQRVHAKRLNDTVFALLKWGAGRFVLKAAPATCQSDEGPLDLHVDTQQTLLDAVRRLDEEHRNPPPTKDNAKVDAS